MSSSTARSLVSADSPHVALGVTNARRWTIVGLLFTASLINYFDRATISFALPLILTDDGWRATFAVVGFTALLWLVRWLIITPKRLHGNAAGTAGPSSRGFERTFVSLVTNRNLLGICLGFFCFDYYWYFLVN